MDDLQERIEECIRIAAENNCLDTAEIILIRDMCAKIGELTAIVSCKNMGNSALLKIVVKQKDEIERLQKVMRNAREVYINMDGFIPETAPEGYCMRIVEQMYEELCDKP